MTPQVIEQAKALARDPQQGAKVNELHAVTHQWAGHVRQLVDATQNANLPWSKTAERLVTAAKSGEALDVQVCTCNHGINCRPTRMTWTNYSNYSKLPTYSKLKCTTVNYLRTVN